MAKTVEDYPLIMALAILWQQKNCVGIPTEQLIAVTRARTVLDADQTIFDMAETTLRAATAVTEIKTLFNQLESGQLILTEAQQIIMAKACGCAS